MSEEREFSGYVVKLHTSIFRGDHTAEVCEIIDVSGDTCISDLAKNAFHWETPVSQRDECRFDWVEIRPIYKKMDDAK